MRDIFKKIGIFLTLLLITIFFVRSKPVSSKNQEEYAPDEVIVKFKPGVDKTRQAEIHAQVGIFSKKEIGRSGAFVVKVPSGRVKEKVEAYQRNPQVLYAEPNYIVKALDFPNDEYFSNQWHFNNTGQSGGYSDADIDWLETWNLTKAETGQAVKIAILDSGIDQDHEDLAVKVVASKNFSSSSTVDDLYGHGTHVAGIAAAMTNNSDGVAGTGYDSVIRLLNAKVLNDQAVGYDSWVAEGIYWAVENGANIINMSFGGNNASDILKDAVDDAWSEGVVLVAAAGNSNDATFTYPAAYENCLAVAATNHFDKRASFSSYGNWVEVAAPGENIFSTFPNHRFSLGRGRWGKSKNYDYGSGTSMSTPMVSGLASLILAYNKGDANNDGVVSNSEVWSQIENSCDLVFDDCGTVDCWQWGRINACEAMGGDCPYEPGRPSPSPSPSPTPEPTAEPTPTPEPTLSPSPSADQCSNCFKGVCDGHCHPVKEDGSCPDCQ